MEEGSVVESAAGRSFHGFQPSRLSGVLLHWGTDVLICIHVVSNKCIYIYIYTVNFKNKFFIVAFYLHNIQKWSWTEVVL